MRKLHLVGFTADREGLIFTARRGSKSGSFVVNIEDSLLDHLAEAQRRRNGEEVEAEPEEAPADAGRARPKAALTPREMQARLRAGQSIAEVAAEAHVDPEWVEGFAIPIMAEQAQMVEMARSLTYGKPRGGPSVAPLGDSVESNLAERGVTMADDGPGPVWSAHQLDEGLWVVRVRYRSRGRVQEAVWELDVAKAQLISRNRLATELGYLEKGRKRRAIARPSPPSTPAPDQAQSGARTRRRAAATRPSAARPGATARPRAAATRGPASSAARRRPAATRPAKVARPAKAARGAVKASRPTKVGRPAPAKSSKAAAKEKAPSRARAASAASAASKASKARATPKTRPATKAKTAGKTRATARSAKAVSAGPRAATGPTAATAVHEAAGTAGTAADRSAAGSNGHEPPASTSSTGSPRVPVNRLAASRVTATRTRASRAVLSRPLLPRAPQQEPPPPPRARWTPPPVPEARPAARADQVKPAASPRPPVEAQPEVPPRRRRADPDDGPSAGRSSELFDVDALLDEPPPAADHALGHEDVSDLLDDVPSREQPVIAAERAARLAVPGRPNRASALGRRPAAWPMGAG